MKIHKHIGAPVWQVWKGILRFGKIKNTFMKDRWRYYDVEWDDHRDQEPVRCDNVTFTDLDRLNISIRKLQKGA
tara:strand:- start:58 stop:279 length:222 start_codon:yes stop_codon:yes gene_type:complete